jgi:putative endonuclease
VFFVYILYSQRIARFYVGYTNDINRRIAEHNRIKGKYTDRGIPWQLAYTECFSSKEEAAKREAFIKAQKSKAYIENLIRCQETSTFLCK